ncbi:hypothetical protein B0H13DRAFT_2478641 [Mycena leptocephala]|nr:hypothetical protein B0H13DRAFT_2478641 [Mycena leptocephala]
MYRIPEPHTTSYSVCPLSFPVYRVGTMGDGGKYVCGLERAPSIRTAWSTPMGVETKSSFEQEVLTQSRIARSTVRSASLLIISPGQRVNDLHSGFDFSVSEWGPELRGDNKSTRRPFLSVQDRCGGSARCGSEGVSLPGIMGELGMIHRYLEEGWEFSALTAIIESFKGKPLPFGQMQIEIHLNYGSQLITTDIATVGAFDKW